MDQMHQDQPVYHLYDPSGWVNDPNGPLYYKGKYHMFFQNVTDSTKWTWGLGWGHSVSTDLLHWRQLPPALTPDPGWYDADGCFSGCATVDADGVPAILYTGVVKKPDAGEREGMPLTVNKLCYERQLLARPADPDDPDLTEWVKVPRPFLSEHMAPLPINCFRDPFLLERPRHDNGWTWRVMVGSNIDVSELTAAHTAAQLAAHDPTAAGGLAGTSAGTISSAGEVGSWADAVQAAAAAAVAAGGGSGGVGPESQLGETLGTATVYRSRTKDLEGGWDYEGLLCVAKPGEGAIWECPIMAPLAPPILPPPAAAGAPTSAAAGPPQHPQQHTATAALHPTPPASQALTSPPPPPSPPAEAGVASAGGAAAGAAEAAPLHGAVAATADSQAVQREKEHQAALEVERAMSGCLGLWDAPGTASGTNSSSAEGECSVGSTSKQSAQQQQGLALQRQQQRPLPPSHLFSVSAGVCPAIYWLGRYGDGKFDLESADGPHALDLGDVLYAPNLMEDAQGRQIIWGWLQEHPSPVSHDYSGCISLPRTLQLAVKHRKASRRSSLQLTPSSSSNTSTPTAPAAAPAHSLNSHSTHPQQHHQQQQGDAGEGSTPTSGSDSDGSSSSSTEYYLVQNPLPELEQLRSGRGLRLRGIRLPAGKPWSVPSQVSASHLDLTLTVRPAPGAQRFQVLLGPLRQEGEQQQDVGTTSHAFTAAAAAPAGYVGGSDAAAGAAAVDGPAGPSASSNVVPTSSLNFVPVTPEAADRSAPAAAAGGTGLAPLFTPSSAAAGGGWIGSGLNPLDSPNSPISPTEMTEVVPLMPSVGPAAGTTSSAGGASGHAAAAAPGVDAAASTLSNIAALLPGSMSASNSTGMAGAIAAAGNAPGGGSSSAGLSPFAGPATEVAAACSSSSAGSGGNATSSGAFGLPSELSDHTSALAAAAAAEAVSQEHHQAAAITYEFGSAQLQVLTGPPGPLLKLLKQQQEELAAATAPAAAGDRGSSSSAHNTAAAAAAAGLQSRTAVPTADTLGFEPPVLPSAPTGALTASMAAAEAAGVRVLACQLRELHPDEPLQMRLLLDYSIAEVFFGTGEAFTTRVYRGQPTARAAEVAMKKVATRAATEAAEAEHMSMSGSLANLGLLLQQQLLARTGSGRLLAQAGSVSGLSGFSSPPDVSSPRVDSARTSLDSRPDRLVIPDSPSSPHTSLAALGTSTAVQQQQQQQGGKAPEMPLSPATAVTGPFVHYFSPHRNLSARVGALRPPPIALPTLAGISEVSADQAGASGAAGGDGDNGGVGSAAAGLFGFGGGEAESSGGKGFLDAAGGNDSAAGIPGGFGREGRQQVLFHAVDDPEAGSSSAAATHGSSSISALAAAAGALADPDTAAATAAADGSSSAASSSRRTSTSSREESLEAWDTDRIRDSFPGFSPHKPPAPPRIAAGGAWPAAGPEAPGSGGSGSEPAGGSGSEMGAKLTSWFQKMTRSSKSKGRKAGSSGSSKSRVVVPETFGVPVPPQLTPFAAAAAAARDADVGGGSDAVSAMHSDQQEGSSAQREKAKAAATNTASSSSSSAPSQTARALPSLQVKVDNNRVSNLSVAAPGVTDTAASANSTQQQQQQQRQPGSASGSPVSPPAAGSTTSSVGVLSPRSPVSARSSPFAARSPRRNWRSAFVLTDGDEQASSIGGRGGVGAMLGGFWSGVGGVRAGEPAVDPQVAEYGMYAHVLAPGAAGAVGSSGGSAAVGGVMGKEGPAVGACGGVTAGVSSTAGAAAGSGKQQSGYVVPGAMRELSLVALGGGGVVLRLEAYEMASMWDE